jgi:hypothetical protein
MLLNIWKKNQSIGKYNNIININFPQIRICKNALLNK